MHAHQKTGHFTAKSLESSWLECHFSTKARNVLHCHHPKFGQFFQSQCLFSLPKKCSSLTRPQWGNLESRDVMNLHLNKCCNYLCSFSKKKPKKQKTQGQHLILFFSCLPNATYQQGQEAFLLNCRHQISNISIT